MQNTVFIQTFPKRGSDGEQSQEVHLDTCDGIHRKNVKKISGQYYFLYANVPLRSHGDNVEWQSL